MKTLEMLGSPLSDNVHYCSNVRSSLRLSAPALSVSCLLSELVINNPVLAQTGVVVGNAVVVGAGVVTVKGVVVAKGLVVVVGMLVPGT